MKKTVYIRADGSSEIGLGHLVRCLALADMLKDDFFIHFVSKDIPKKIAEEITGKGFLLGRISFEKEFFSLLTGDEIVVLDHYDFNSDYQRKVKESGNQLVCIDDLHDETFHADLIINHSPAVKPEDYSVQGDTRFALGPRYALLRPVFLKAAAQERVIEEFETVLICFGGADPRNITRKVLKVVQKSPDLREIAVVLGAAYSHRESLDEILKNDERIKLRSSLNDKEMLAAMKAADLAIVPASGILFEILAAGTNPLICYNAENQKELFDYFNEKDVLPTFDPEEFDIHKLRMAMDKFNSDTDSKINQIRSEIKGSSCNNLSNFIKLSQWKMMCNLNK